MVAFPFVSRPQGPEIVKPGSLSKPELYLDDFMPGEILMTESEFAALMKLHDTTEEIATSIHPVGITFGTDESVMQRSRPRPFLCIDNHDQLRNHRIYLQRQKLEHQPIAVQYHFLESRLFCVSYEYNRQPEGISGAMKACLNGFHAKISDTTTAFQGKKIWQDPSGNLLSVSGPAGFRAVYFSSHYWLHHD